jgi:hypothetical protein
MMRLSLLTAVALQAGLLFQVIPAAMAQNKTNVTGAIFTTVSDGTTVNANLYHSKCLVYLSGGPGVHAPSGAAGLPDGDYYFQVTDPSGKQLLNTDAVSNRRFTILNGVIMAYTGVGGPVHPVGFDHVHPELNAITIQAANASCPTDFLDSPNNGGAYKIWATPVSSFSGDATLVDNACGAGCFHGFWPSQSKTDNFKATLATATFCVTVQTSFLQPDGVTITPGVNWQMTLTDPLGVSNSYFTNSTGQVQVCGLTAGTYTVTEKVLGTQVIGLNVNGTVLPAQPIYSFTWSVGQAGVILTFENIVLQVG